jgi:hypothetical protein
MRTTLEIDDDVLALAQDLAHAQRQSVGHVISDLARTALAEPTRAALAAMAAAQPEDEETEEVKAAE